MKELILKIKEVGLINTIKGVFRRSYYKSLQKKHDFDSWHTSPYELRSYAQAVVKYINSKEPVEHEIVDIGCGLGEVIRNIKAPNKIGYDLSANVIEVAKKLDQKSTAYCVGSFDEFGKGHTVDYLITLGFMHGGREDMWVEPYTKITSENDIKHVIVDIIPEGVDHAHRLDFTKILPEEYHLIESLGPFRSGRSIEVYAK